MNILTSIKLAVCLECKITYFKLKPSCQQENIYSNWKELFILKKKEVRNCTKCHDFPQAHLSNLIWIFTV